MAGDDRVTLLRPPPNDSSKAPIENALEVTELAVLGKDIFTNARPLWHPPGARGIYGGAVIAQSLASAQVTVPDDFLPHSCHCYFLLAGDSAVPILYHVERVRDGRSFATRTVQARQKGHCIFTTTISFVRDVKVKAGGQQQQQQHQQQATHAQSLPVGAKASCPQDDGEGDLGDSPVVNRRLAMTNSDSKDIYERKTRSWTRSRGKISPGGGLRAHLNALAYMSDSYFIGTISRVHRLWRYPWRPSAVPSLPAERRRAVVDDACRADGMTLEEWEARPEVSMMVSLDHSIYFHEPRRVRADEWMFVEMESPWAGDGRGVVMQRVWAGDGTLLATCVQEGVVRLKKDGTEKSGNL